jgi:hypothetical protein
MPSLKQPSAVKLFQLLDLKGNSRLRHKECIGSTGEIEMPGDGKEDLQTPVSHGVLLKY